MADTLGIEDMPELLNDDSDNEQPSMVLPWRSESDWLAVAEERPSGAGRSMPIMSQLLLYCGLSVMEDEFSRYPTMGEPMSGNKGAITPLCDRGDINRLCC